MFSTVANENFLYKTLLSSEKIGLFQIDDDFNCIQWNVGMELLTGINSNIIINKSFLSHFPELKKSDFFQSITKLNKNRENDSDETSLNLSPFWCNSKDLYKYSITSFNNISNTKRLVVIEKIEDKQTILNDKLENEFKIISENSGFGIWKLNNDGLTEYVNSFMCDILGTSKEEVIGKRFDKFFTSESLPKLSEELSKRKLKISSVYDVDLIRKDGDIRNIRINGAPVINQEGKVDGTIGTFLDLTKNKKREKELINSEEQFRTLFEKNNIPTALYNNGTHILVNDAYVKLFGFDSAHEIIGTHVLEYIPEHERETVIKQIQDRYINSSNTIEKPYQSLGVKKDGSIFNLQFQGSFYISELGKLTIGSVTDISEQKKAEFELLQSEAKFRGVFESSIIGVVFCDHNKIYDANDKFLSITGYSREDLENGIITWDCLTPKDQSKLIEKVGQEICTQGFSTPLETEYLKKDNTRIPVLITASLVPNIDQNKYGTGVGFVINLSRLKKTQNEVLKISNELSTFLYMASHDLKGPLASIIGLTYVALQELGDEKSIEYFKLIRECTTKLDHSLMNYLKIIKIKSAIFDNSSIQFETILNEVFDNVKLSSKRDNINFTFQIPQIKEFHSDPELIQCIFQNLIENSVKFFTCFRSLAINVSIEEINNYLIIKVEDNGKGINENNIDRIFDIYFRGDNSSKGSGLGLYIVKTAVETLQGSIFVANKQEGGTIFEIRLPYLPLAFEI